MTGTFLKKMVIKTLKPPFFLVLLRTHLILLHMVFEILHTKYCSHQPHQEYTRIRRIDRDLLSRTPPFGTTNTWSCYSLRIVPRFYFIKNRKSRKSCFPISVSFPFNQQPDCAICCAIIHLHHIWDDVVILPWKIAMCFSWVHYFPMMSWRLP